MQRFLAAAAYSFFIVAALILWEVYKATEGFRFNVGNPKIRLYLAMMVCCLMLGVVGIKARHRRDRDGDDGNLDL